MAKTKESKETITPLDDLSTLVVAEGQVFIAEGKTKVEAAMAIYRHLHESPHEVFLQAFVEGASLTPKGALPYWSVSVVI